MLHLPFIYVRPSPLGGRGVYTAEPIPAGTVVERAPVVVLSPEDRAIIHGTGLHDYYFLWDGDGAAIALGYGSLYNHASEPNLAFEMDYEFEQIRFSAERDIAGGEELLIDYVVGGGEALWF
ncbi:SET domain-containing protein [Lewinella sp. IMCC34183]|uniref:SET domain-containing protein n=1 Tax=Lewinella sp. IMCC34183 TaxID=2248762 RepID=UPI000E242DCE|nr:SET domain-containing protein [Lewinella sp. IMCC34183]